SNKKTGKAGKPDEAGEKLQKVIPVRVVDDRTHSESSPCVGLGGKLRAQPPHRIGLQLIVSLVVPSPIGPDDLCEVVAIDHFAEGSQLPGYHVLGLAARLLRLLQRL